MPRRYRRPPRYQFPHETWKGIGAVLRVLLPTLPDDEVRKGLSIAYAARRLMKELARFPVHLHDELLPIMGAETIRAAQKYHHGVGRALGPLPSRVRRPLSGEDDPRAVVDLKGWWPVYLDVNSQGEVALVGAEDNLYVTAPDAPPVICRQGDPPPHLHCCGYVALYEQEEEWEHLDAWARVVAGGRTILFNDSWVAYRIRIDAIQLTPKFLTIIRQLRAGQLESRFDCPVTIAGEEGGGHVSLQDL